MSERSHLVILYSEAIIIPPQFDERDSLPKSYSLLTPLSNGFLRSFGAVSSKGESSASTVN